MQFWTVPDQAGLPTVSAAAVVNEGGVNPNIGKGALLFLNSGFAVTMSVAEITWEDLNYDDLGFSDFPTDKEAFIIPTIEPAINNVFFFGQNLLENGGAAGLLTTRLQINGQNLNNAGVGPRVELATDVGGGTSTGRGYHWRSYNIPVTPGSRWTVEAFASIQPTNLREFTYFGVVVNS